MGRLDPTDDDGGDCQMTTNAFSGTIPALMTPCTKERKPDFDALVRKGKELVALGMSGVVYCGSMGDWPLLTDEERMAGVERLVGGRRARHRRNGRAEHARRRGSGRARQSAAAQGA